MPQVSFRLKGFLPTLRIPRGVVRPLSTIKIGDDLLIPDRFVVRDGDFLDLPVGDYTIEFPNNGSDVKGHFTVSANADLADIFVEDNGYELPPSIPLSAVNGLIGALASKVETNDLRLTPASPSQSGLLSSSDKVKLNGIATGATANAADSFLLNRANHTGSQAIATITGLQSALDGKVTLGDLGSAAFQSSSAFATSAQGLKADSALQPGALIGSISGLQPALDGKVSITSLGSAAYQPTSAFATATQGVLASSALQPGAATSSINGLQTTLDNKANTADLGSAAFQNTTAFATASQGAKADTALQSGAAILSISGLQTALNSKANTTDLGSAAFQPSSAFATALQGSKADSALQPNAAIASISGLQTALNGKLDTGSFLSINNNDRLRLTATGGGPSIDLFRAGGMTLYHGNSASLPVSISTYQRDASPEYGISVPLLKCSGGRFDFDPLDDKAEFRISGASTQFNIYNVTGNYPLFRINSDRTVQTFNTIVSAGGLTVNSASASTSTTNGSGTFAGGVGIAGDLNAGGYGSFNGVRCSSSAPFFFDQQSAPSNPTNGTKWLERDASWNEIATWIWDGTRWASPLFGYSPPAAQGLGGASSRGWTVAYPGFGSGIIVKSISLVGRANGSNHSTSSFLNFQNVLNLNDNTSSNLGTQQNTQTLVTTGSIKIAVSPNVTVPWLNFNSIGTNFSLGTGSPVMSYRMEANIVVYR